LGVSSSAFVLAYNQTVLHANESVLLVAVNVAAAVEFFTIPLYGILSDNWSRRAVYSCGCLFLMAFALPYYALLHTRERVWIILATTLALAGGHAVLYSVQASLIPELFGTRLRNTGASIGYQLAAPVAEGCLPCRPSGSWRPFPIRSGR
jgi:MFS transporter, MHS family, shikimate and dehydroshikimate transport protein